MTRLKIIISVVYILNFVHIGLACDLNVCDAFRRTAELSFNAEKQTFCRSLRGYLVCLRKLSDDCIHDNHVKQVLARYSFSCHSKHETQDDDLRISYFETVKNTDGLVKNNKRRKRKRKLEKLRDDLFDDVEKKVGKHGDNLYGVIGKKVGKQRDDLYDDIGEKVGKQRDDLYDDIGGKARKTKKKKIDRDDKDDTGKREGNVKGLPKLLDDLFDDTGDDKGENNGKTEWEDTHGLFDNKIDKGKRPSRKYKDDYFDDVSDDKNFSDNRYISRFGYQNPANKKYRTVSDEDDSDGISVENYLEQNAFNSAEEGDWDSYESDDHFDEINEHIKELYNKYDLKKRPSRKYKDDYFDDVYDDKNRSDYISRFGYRKPLNFKSRKHSRFHPASKQYRTPNEDASDGISAENYLEQNAFNSAEDSDWGSDDHFDEIQEHIKELYSKYYLKKRPSRKYKDDYFDDVYNDKRYYISRFGYRNPNYKNRKHSRFHPASKKYRTPNDDGSDGISAENYFEQNAFNSAEDNDWGSYETAGRFDKINEDLKELYNRYDFENSDEDDDVDWNDSNESPVIVNKNKQTALMRHNQLYRNSDETSDYFEDVFEDPFDIDFDMHPDMFVNKYKMYRNPDVDDLFDADDTFSDENIVGMLKHKQMSVIHKLDDNSSEEKRDGLYRKDITNDRDSNSDEIWPTMIGTRNKVGLQLNRHFSNSDEIDDHKMSTPWKRRDVFLPNSDENIRDTESESDEPLTPKRFFRPLPFSRRTPFRQRSPQLRKPIDPNLFYTKRRNENNFPNGLKFLSDSVRAPNKFGIITDSKPKQTTTLHRSEGFSPYIERVQLFNKEPIKELYAKTRNRKWLFSERHTGPQKQIPEPIKELSAKTRNRKWLFSERHTGPQQQIPEPIKELSAKTRNQEWLFSERHTGPQKQIPEPNKELSVKTGNHEWLFSERQTGPQKQIPEPIEKLSAKTRNQKSLFSERHTGLQKQIPDFANSGSNLQQALSVLLCSLLILFV